MESEETKRLGKVERDLSSIYMAVGGNEWSSGLHDRVKELEANVARIKDQVDRLIDGQKLQNKLVGALTAAISFAAIIFGAS